MKSRGLELSLIYLCIGLFTFYLTSSLLPFWGSIAISSIAVFATILLSGNLGCSMILTLPLLLFGAIFISGALKLEFSTALLVALSAILTTLIYTGDNFLSIGAMFGLGIYMAFAKPHHPLVDSFMFVAIIASWYVVKIRKVNSKRLLQLFLVAIILSISVWKLDVYPLRSIIATLPNFEEKTAEQQIQIEERISTGTRILHRTTQETGSNWLSKLVEKIWMPMILLLFGVFLFSFSITNFGVKGTLKLFLLGVLLFTIFTTITSMVFRLIKPRQDLFLLEQSYSTSLEGEDDVERLMISRQVMVEEAVERSRRNFTIIMDLLTLALLVFTSVLVVVYVLRSRKNLALEPKEVKDSRIPEDVDLYPLDKVPEFVPTEEFVKAAYWWMRRKYFQNLHHLTPRELIKSFGQKLVAFERLTAVYEKVRYSGRNVNREEIEEFYQNLLETITVIEQLSATVNNQEEQGA